MQTHNTTVNMFNLNKIYIKKKFNYLRLFIVQIRANIKIKFFMSILKVNIFKNNTLLTYTLQKQNIHIFGLLEQFIGIQNMICC